MTELVREFPNPVFRCVSLTEVRPRQSTLTLTIVSQVYGHPWTLALVNPRVIAPEGASIGDARQRLLDQKWTLATVLKNENNGQISFVFDCEDTVGGTPAVSIRARAYEEKEGR